MKRIPRESYLQILRSMRDSNLIKVLTGIRRSGKSTILEMFRDELIEEGVPTKQILSYSFEDPNLNTKPWKDIYDDIDSKLVPDKQNYIFLDEIQLVGSFEKLLLGLQSKKNVDLYITGSNAYLLSSELATLLSGRSFEIKVYPFSFSEYLQAFNEDEAPKTLEARFNDYLLYGGFPQAIDTYIKSPSLVDQYITGVYETIVGRDIMDRGKVSSRRILDRITKFLMNNIGNSNSTQKIYDTFVSNKVKTSFHTISSYLESLEASFLFYPVQRLHLQGREILKTQEKVYVADLGFRSALLGREAEVDRGHMLENIVYFELLRRNKNVWIGKTKQGEIDFVTQDENGYTSYYQVAWTTQDEKTLERELTPLKSVDDYAPRYLLTMDYDEPSYDGIRKLNVLKWLTANTNE